MPERVQHMGDLSPDAPAWELKEFDRLDGDYFEHRIQQVQAVHNDKLLTYELDLGYSHKYLTMDFVIWGGTRDLLTGKVNIEHTVGELMEWAEGMRGRPVDLETQEYIETAPASMLDLLRSSIEEGAAQERKASIFGPITRKVRG